RRPRALVLGHLRRQRRAADPRAEEDEAQLLPGARAGRQRQDPTWPGRALARREPDRPRADRIGLRRHPPGARTRDPRGCRPLQRARVTRIGLLVAVAALAAGCGSSTTG